MKLTKVLLCKILVFISPIVKADPAPLNKQLLTYINKGFLDKKFVGAYVVGQDKKVIFSFNENKKMNPASLTKIFTAGAALNYFSPGYQFETHLKVNAIPKNSVVNGSLYLVGGGDPAFTSEKMWFLVNEFVRTGIRKINGDIIVDGSLFDDVRFDDSRDSNRVDRAYDAPVAAMSYNWNSVNVYVRPGLSEGQSAKVYVDPETDYIDLDAKVITKSKKSNCSLEVRRQSKLKKDKIKVRGCVVIDSDEKVFYRSISRPLLWSGYALKSFLEQRNIKVNGKVKMGVSPSHSISLAKAPSQPIQSSVSDMLKFSNNFIAEMLVKNMAAYSKSSKGNLSLGMKYMNKYLKETGTNLDIKIVNPSGLTSDNFVTPKSMAEYLNYLSNRFSVFHELIVGLPVAGVDGTLKGRYDSSKILGRVRAKTGLLKNNGVSAIAGYAYNPTYGRLSFVFIVNTHKSLRSVSRTWKFLDNMVTKLL